jgi:aminoglycoside phosphotransferase (APT) family kinase protein
VNAAPLTPEPARQAILGGLMLAGVEADLLGDDAHLRDLFAELGQLLSAWCVAGDQAVAVHLRLAAEPHDGYESADFDRALADYRFARGLVLTAVQAIADRHEELTHT